MKRINMTGRFNGATLFSLEIPAGLRVSGGSRRLQWGHVFSDVEMSASPCSRQRMDASFNGATSFQTWKLEPLPTGKSIIIWLQWGHVFSDVEISSGWLLKSRSVLLQWGHVFSDVEIRALPVVKRGSAKASMGPRLFRRGNSIRRHKETGGFRLQWGHVFSDVEMPMGGGDTGTRQMASMGPRLFRRGNVSIAINAFGSASSFNGATSFQTWK